MHLLDFILRSFACDSVAPWSDSPVCIVRIIHFALQRYSGYFSHQPEEEIAVTREIFDDRETNKPGPSKRHSEPTAGRLTNRLSSSIGEVLHETSDLEEHSDMDAMRPVTVCAGDDRTLSWLTLYETQQRRLKTRSEWFLQPLLPVAKPGSKSIDFSHYALPSTTAPRYVKTLDGRTISHSTSPMQIVSPLPEESPTEGEMAEGKKNNSNDSSNEDSLATQRQPLAERQNSRKSQGGRLPIQLRSSAQTAPAAPVNIAGWAPTGEPLPATAPTTQPSATSVNVTRRRSWRTHYVRPQLQDVSGKTHSLDLPESPRSSQQRLGKQAHSVGGETWLSDVVGSDEVPKKRRSLKKKSSKPI